MKYGLMLYYTLLYPPKTPVFPRYARAPTLIERYSSTPARTTYGSRAFSHAAPVLWNGLPQDIKISTDLRTFQFRLRKHLLDVALNA
jgi:hypothetical protein